MSQRSCCKVGDTIERRGLETADPRHESLEEGLLARWLGRDGHAESGYRTVTEWFNKRLLRRVYTDRGREAVDARIDSDYEVLTGDDDLQRRYLLDDLEATGIDAEALRDDMVSWGTMRTHLNECLEGTKERPAARTEWERNSIEVARDVTTEKVEDALSSLATKGDLEGVDAATVDVQVYLRCDECPTRVSLERALDQGHVCRRHNAVPTEETDA